MPVAVLLVGLSVLAAAPLFDRVPRERGDEVVAWLVEVQEPGEPVVAADQRSAMALDHYIRDLAPELRADLVLPPDDAPPDADRVWLVRRLFYGEPEPTDDDEILREAGLRMVDDAVLLGRQDRPDHPALGALEDQRRIAQRSEPSDCRSRARGVQADAPTVRCSRATGTLVTGRPARPTARTTLGAPLGHRGEDGGPHRRPHREEGAGVGRQAGQPRGHPAVQRRRSAAGRSDS